MTADEITAQIRLMVLEERARFLKPQDYTQAQTDGINLLAHLLVASAPYYFEKKVSLQPKNTNIHAFELPSDCLGLKKVWDYDGNAVTITGAADNGSGAIRITAASHGLSDENVITIHEMGGCTEANGTWQIDYITANTFDLVGSTFTNAYTSGGKAFLEEDDTYKYPMDRIPGKFQSADDETHYFLNEDDIIIDDPEFEDDLIILYRYLPTSLSEIPSRMHFGIWAYGAIKLLHIPSAEIRADGTRQYHPDYNTLKKNFEFCKGLWETAQGMAMNFNPALGSNNISDVNSTTHKVKRWL
jgi:hypothetical protein